MYWAKRMKHVQEEIAFLCVHVYARAYMCVSMHTHVRMCVHMCWAWEPGKGLGCTKCVYHGLSSKKRTTMTESYFSVLV